MSVIEEVRKDREDLARVLKKHKGIRRTVEELYPDNAHFIYELLQNAEDTKATTASFILNDRALIFEHNGRPFSENDIQAITDIGEGTKTNDEDAIGRFGVGFKAVFAYTETPRIWSPTFSFEITDLVLPREIPARTDLGGNTRFEFPFNNAKKASHVAYAEVLAGLVELAETTLLFLSHLDTIQWHAGNTSGSILRIPHTENHIEVLKQTAGEKTSSLHFLRYTQPVRGIEKQQIALAFKLEELPNITVFDPKLPLSKQLRIAPANPGHVSVFFRAEKESSELRFHLHAPFVPELSRASIKETPVNTPLFNQLAELSASALHSIRDLDLLTGEFLAVLPNPQDPIPARYEPIRAAIIAEMNNEPLTPTQAKSHAPAKHLLQAKVSLKDLLSAKDIEFLIDYSDEPPQWSISAAQKNSNADRFLSGLAIREWDVEEFAKRIELILPNGSYEEVDKEMAGWLAAKSPEWHQQFYSLLYNEFSPYEDLDRFDPLPIIRLSDGTYSVGKKCFFPSETTKQDDLLPRVDETVYSSGRSKTQKEAATKFLEALGVRNVGELEQVQSILDQRYTKGSIKPDPMDLKRFIQLVEKTPEHSKIFAEYFIFKRDDGKWGRPVAIYIDLPFYETGLKAFYDTFSNNAPRRPLAESYTNSNVSIEKIRKFAQAVGAQVSLEVKATSCFDNPHRRYLYDVGGERCTSPIDRDYVIPGLKEILSSPSIEISKLVWRTMCNLPKTPDHLVARYRRNATNGSRHTISQLVHILRECAWIPQCGGGFVRPADANKADLPSGFAFDAGYEWIKAVQFGEGNLQRAQENLNRETAAKELGFSDALTLARAKRFVALPQDDQEKFLAEFDRRQNTDFPEHVPHNPKRRSELVGQEADIAPERIVKQRLRSVSIGREAVKGQTLPYLRAEYTNVDGDMFCQVCKAAMPFKLDDGSFYFEMIEFLPDLKKRHYQNYLALCPNHAAMFQYANGSEDLIQPRLVALDSTELEVVLAQNTMTIKFTQTHLADLKRIVEIDSKPAPINNANSTLIQA